MNRAAEDLLEPTVDPREPVAEEMAKALERLAVDMPRMEAALTLRLAISYLAGVHARHFGHAATVKALIAIARRGLLNANEEFTATRN